MELNENSGAYQILPETFQEFLFFFINYHIRVIEFEMPIKTRIVKRSSLA